MTVCSFFSRYGHWSCQVKNWQSCKVLGPFLSFETLDPPYRKIQNIGLSAVITNHNLDRLGIDLTSFKIAGSIAIDMKFFYFSNIPINNMFFYLSCLNVISCKLQRGIKIYYDFLFNVNSLKTFQLIVLLKLKIRRKITLSITVVCKVFSKDCFRLRN